MISLGDARRSILDAVAPLAPVDVAIARAHGLVLAEAVVAREAVPPFANSAMDGYAVRAVDTGGATPSSPVSAATTA